MIKSNKDKNDCSKDDMSRIQNFESTNDVSELSFAVSTPQKQLDDIYCKLVDDYCKRK